MIPLPSPQKLREVLPLDPHTAAFIATSRETARRIVQGNDERLAFLIGPCSLHSFETALTYAKRFKSLADEASPSSFLVMRAFIEKSRTGTGWKGFLYDPSLAGLSSLEEGLIASRRLLLELASLEIPLAMEFVDPIIAPYFEDLITWGLIGARTSSSQPHRQLASSLPFPVGLKNSIDGNVDTAIHAVCAAKAPHHFFGIHPSGGLAACTSTGNPCSHIVLRGSETAPNYDPLSIEHAAISLSKVGLFPRLMIDCAHGNSGKDTARQIDAFSSVLRQIEEQSPHIFGLMLESHLEEGFQSSPPCPHKAQSITDPCLGWDTTARLISLATSLKSYS